MVLLRPAAQHVLVDKNFSPSEVDLPDAETRGFFEVRREFREGDLLQPIIVRRRRRIAVPAAKIAERALQHPEVFQHRTESEALGLYESARFATRVRQFEAIGVLLVASRFQIHKSIAAFFSIPRCRKAAPRAAPNAT